MSTWMILRVPIWQRYYSGVPECCGRDSRIGPTSNCRGVNSRLEARAGVQPYQSGFLLHYLDKLVYPDISASVLTVAGMVICALNLMFYARQMWSNQKKPSQMM
jgi:hypothetical protein